MISNKLQEIIRSVVQEEVTGYDSAMRVVAGKPDRIFEDHSNYKIGDQVDLIKGQEVAWINVHGKFQATKLLKPMTVEIKNINTSNKQWQVKVQPLNDRSRYYFIKIDSIE